MKKIITVLTAVLLLCSMVFSLASCGKVDMAETKTKIQAIVAQDKTITAIYTEGVVSTNTAAKHNIYKVYMTPAGESDSTESLIITEYANNKLAKIQYKLEKYRADELAEYNELNEQYDEACREVGDKVDETVEKVIVRKGNVLIVGSEKLYERIFD